MSFLNIKSELQKEFIISQINELNNKQSFVFYGYDTLQLTNFVEKLEEYKINYPIDLSIKYKEQDEVVYLKNNTINFNKDRYIRDLIIDNKVLGGDNASQGLSVETIILTLNIEDIEFLLTSYDLSHFNLYNIGETLNIPFEFLFKNNQIKQVLVLIKNKKYKVCPFLIFLELLNKKMPIEIKRDIFESFRVLKSYYDCKKCNNFDIYKAIKFLDYNLNENLELEDYSIIIYIIESLGYLGINQNAKSMIWNSANSFFNKRDIYLKDSHIVWSFLVSLDNNKAFKYDIKFINLIKKLDKIINDNYKEVDEFPILETLLERLKRFFLI